MLKSQLNIPVFSPPTNTKAKNKLTILTPCVQTKENKYLTCLWSSLSNYEVSVEAFKVDCFLSELITAKPHHKIIHLHWLADLCYLKNNSRRKTISSCLAMIRNLLLLRLWGNKIVWTIHNTHSHNHYFPRLETLLRWLLSRLAHDILVMSEYGRQEFQRMYRRSKRVHIVPHGNYIGSYPNQISRIDARQNLGIASKQKVLLFFGMVRHYKGIDRLLAGLEQLQEPNVVLIIAGIPHDKDLCAEIEQAAKQDSRIRPQFKFIPDEDIQIYMNACDWVVLPYKKILNSASVLLASSYARPVIVPQRGAITELINDGEQGYCYAKDSDLPVAINRALATSKEQWQQMCDRSYEFAKKYDWSKIGQKLYRIYSQ